MGFAAIIALVLACFAYIFWPWLPVAAPPEKTRVDYLRERKEAIYDGLRDLNFEYLAGKYPEADFEAQRANLEDEAVRVMAEMDMLQRHHG